MVHISKLELKKKIPETVKYIIFSFHPKELEFSRTSIRGRPKKILDNAGIPEPRVPGVPNFWQNKGQIMPTNYYILTPNFFYLSTFLDVSGAPVAFKTWRGHLI